MTISFDQLTEGKIGGTGVFDKLMAVQKAYLDEEYKANRIKGPEYSTVYLGSLQTTMDTALRLLLSTEEMNLKLQLMAKEVEIANVKLQQAGVELQQAQKQLEILEATLPKVEAEAALLGQQKLNLQDELLTTAKQRLKLDEDIELAKKQTLDVVQRTANAVLEGTVLVAQECKLRAEYDVVMLNKDKTISETGLLNQKTLTERAQIVGSGVDADSVIGKQKGLFTAQTNGFKRDAENKAARLMADTWNVRRTTDSGTSANSTNKLDDATVGAVIQAMINGLSAP